MWVVFLYIYIVLLYTQKAILGQHFALGKWKQPLEMKLTEHFKLNITEHWCRRQKCPVNHYSCYIEIMIKNDLSTKISTNHKNLCSLQKFRSVIKVNIKKGKQYCLVEMNENLFSTVLMIMTSSRRKEMKD